MTSTDQEFPKNVIISGVLLW